MRNRSPVALLLIVAITAAVSGADAPVKWDIQRTTPPNDSAEARALQAAVKAMVEKTTPATVALFYQSGAGSGAIVSEDGLILTAAHVVSPSPLGEGGGRRRNGAGGADAPTTKKVRIQLADGNMVNGTVLGRDPSLDSAMVKITDPVPKGSKWPGADQGKWPMVELGKSSDLKKGQWVVALGHPGGPKQERRPPVRLGQIVSDKNEGRRLVSDCTLVGGDSGGPLFDLDGKLIGIHSSIGNDLSQNFHIPTHVFQNEWKRLLRGDNIGARTSAWLGIVLAGDEKDKDRANRKPEIEEVRTGSPADNAGLKVGDLILEFKGEKVDSSEDIDQMMLGTRSGENVLIKVRRGAETYELEVTLGKRPSN